MKIKWTFLLTGLLIGLTHISAQSPFKLIKNFDTQRSSAFADRVIHYDIDLKQLTSTSRNTQDILELSVPTLDGDKVLELERFQLLAGSYQLLNQEGEQESEAKRHKFYRGTVKGEEGSIVGLSIIDDELHLLIHDAYGSFEVKKLKDKSGKYAGFYTEEILDKNFIDCETDTEKDYGIISQKAEAESRSGQLECVEIYLEIDHKAYTENGSSLSSVESWALALMAQVAIFFDDSEIPITVSGMKIYETSASDPYLPEGNTAEALSAFRDSMSNQGFNGRLAHLLSGRGLGGGRAYLNVLCSSVYNVGVSGNLNSGGTTYSTYTWNINVIAHELGHNFGANHTHDCVWNGNNTQIDDCGNVWAENNGYSTGSCYDITNKILPGNGNATIMSYCHVASGASINLNLGFHPQVRDRMYSRYSSTNCSGSETCVGVPPANNVCADAIRLTPTIGCVVTAADNEYATDSGVLPNFSCGGTVGVKDVWFVVKIPENGQLKIETSTLNGGLSDLVLQVYSGACGSFVAEYCDDDSGTGSHALVDINNINLADQDIFIRVVSKNDSEGAFGICAYSPNLPCNEVADALIAFYNAQGGSTWTNKNGWEDGANGNDCNYCTWYGVTCNASEQVVNINLYNNNLSGDLSSSLLPLGNLKNLNLSNNNLTGEIPLEVINMDAILTVDLSSNNLIGNVPSDLMAAPLLESLSLAGNQLSGNLPEFSYSSKLNFLSLSNNDFSGCYPGPYTRFLYQGEVDLYGNPNLPFSGNFYERPSDYAGFDFDEDGHCFEVDDCRDFDENTYDGAPEICDGEDNDCDGEVDENLNAGPNVWIGPSSGGMWNDDTNWSLSHIPKACEDVEIGMGGEAIEITQTGSQQGFSQDLKSLCLGPNAMLDMGNRFYLTVKRGYLLNMGNMNFKAYTSLSNTDSTKPSISNFGNLTIDASSYINLSAIGTHAIKNNSGGTIINNGNLFIDGGVNQVNIGLLNESMISNTGTITIIGDYGNSELIIKSSSTINNTGVMNIGGESYGGEGSN